MFENGANTGAIYCRNNGNKFDMFVGRIAPSLILYCLTVAVVPPGSNLVRMFVRYSARNGKEAGKFDYLDGGTQDY